MMEGLQLSNSGGILVLKNAEGARVDHVRYGKEEVKSSRKVMFTRTPHRGA